MTARLLDLTHDEYLAHPGFNASTAKVLHRRSPAHALEALRKKPTRAMDRGDIIHHLVLGAGKALSVERYADWRTDKAKAAKAAAYAAKTVPVLEHELEEYAIAAEAIRVALADRGIVLDGVSEQAIEWTESTSHGPLLCKGRFDHVWLRAGGILDLKVTENAALDSIERTAENLDYAIQYAAYTRGLVDYDKTLAGLARFLFAFAEPYPPYALNLVEPSGTFRELGERRWLSAVATWAHCKATNEWPGYGSAINTINPPGWALHKEGFTTDE